MAGSSYYYSTPIGQGMSNIAQAIGSVPKRQAEVGLLEARQRLIDEQILSQESLRQTHGATARYHNLQGDEIAQAMRGRNEMAEVYYNPEEAAALPAGLPQAVVGPAGVAQGSQPVVPEAGLVPAVVPRNATGVTEDKIRRLARAASLIGKDKAAEILSMYGSGNLAANVTDNEKAMSYLQGGAGIDFANTPQGRRDTLGQLTQAANIKAAADRYGVDVGARTDIRKAEIGADADIKKGERDTKTKAKTLTFDQQTKLLDEVIGAGKGSGVDLDEGEAAAVVEKIAQRVASGENYAKVVADEKTKMIRFVGEEELAPSGDNWFGRNRPAYNAFNPPTADAGWPTEAPQLTREMLGKLKVGEPVTIATGEIVKYNGKDAGGKPKWARR